MEEKLRYYVFTLGMILASAGYTGSVINHYFDRPLEQGLFQSSFFFGLIVFVISSPFVINHARQVKREMQETEEQFKRAKQSAKAANKETPSFFVRKAAIGFENAPYAHCRNCGLVENNQCITWGEFRANCEVAEPIQE